MKYPHNTKLLGLTFFVKIMSLYEELIQLKIAKNPGYRDGLLELETRRNYRFRIDTLSTDINSINEALRILQEKLARMEGDWMSQVSKYFWKNL